MALFLHQRVGVWTIADARLFLGEPVGGRMVFDEDRRPSSRILAFPDPTRRYRQVELDFDPEHGILRSVFVYPVNLTWETCRQRWGTNVRAAQANKGRIFYSYEDRRLDVLVGPGGKVINLGLY